MSEDDQVRRAQYGAQCTLGFWQRRMADIVTRKLRFGYSADAQEVELINQNITYWQGEIARLQDWLDSRPREWGTW